MRSVKVLGREILIKHVTKAKLEELTGDSDTEAWFNPLTGTIYMSIDLEPQAYRRILLHEIFHATMSVSGLGNLLDDKIEEAMADAMESWLDFFKSEEFIAEMSGE